MAGWKWKIDQQEYEVRKLAERAPELADAVQSGSISRNAALIKARLRSRQITVFAGPAQKTADDLCRVLGREAASDVARWILSGEERDHGGLHD